ncbi:MAG TPA: hypothetical protein VIF62_15850 [Labilithrix sp.]
MRGRLAGAFVALALAMIAVDARAQMAPGGGPMGPVGPAPGNGQGPSGPATGGAQGGAHPTENAPESPGEPPVESPGSVKLFDSKRSVSGFELDAGPIWYRQAKPTRDDFTQAKVGEILFGTSITTRWKPFFLSGMQQTHFRWFDSKSFAWTLLSSYLGVGAYLGPLEPEVRVGVGLVTVDVFHGEWSGEMLTPRVSAGVGIKAGKIRVDIQAHSEYLWRWFGPFPESAP